MLREVGTLTLEPRAQKERFPFENESAFICEIVFFFFLVSPGNRQVLVLRHRATHHTAPTAAAAALLEAGFKTTHPLYSPVPQSRVASRA